MSEADSEIILRQKISGALARGVSLFGGTLRVRYFYRRWVTESASLIAEGSLNKKSGVCFVNLRDLSYLCE